MAANTRILIVDDEDVLRQMVLRVMKFMGIQSDIADDGFMALEKLSANTYDIVIADIRMPNMDGIELLKQVKRDYPGTDVLIMTAHSSKYSYVDVVESGASDFVSKPFSVEELKAKIERMLRERGVMAELANKNAQIESVCREINSEKVLLQREIERLRDENRSLAEALQGKKN